MMSMSLFPVVYDVEIFDSLTAPDFDTVEPEWQVRTVSAYVTASLDVDPALQAQRILLLTPNHPCQYF
jgi:hypothetical protein